MNRPVPRRALLSAGTVAVATAGLAPAALAGGNGNGNGNGNGHSGGHGGGDGGRSRTVPFTLQATVLDGGEQVTAVRLDASRQGGLRSGELPAGTFTVHSRGTNPLTGEVAHDVDRVVTAASIDRRGTITLELEHGDGIEGAGTLAYLVESGRNVLLDLEYTLTQELDLPTRGRGTSRIDAFEQGELVDAEVDAFSSHVSASGMNYRLFTPPRRRGKHRETALVVWLHGGGEGGIGAGGADYYDNEAPLRANRGALGLATEEAQDLFGGALVVVPQCPSAWMTDGPAFAPLISEIVEEVTAGHRVDEDRIHVTGCSNGGYMTLKMIVENPDVYASAVPICGVVEGFGGAGGPLVPDEQLREISIPTWLIASADDDTVDPQANTVHAHELIPASIMSLYDTVTWEGVQYPGHWSWIYAARNDPSHDGQSLWEWMADQQR